MSIQLVNSREAFRAQQQRLEAENAEQRRALLIELNTKLLNWGPHVEYLVVHDKFLVFEYELKLNGYYIEHRESPYIAIFFKCMAGCPGNCTCAYSSDHFHMCRCGAGCGRLNVR